jgi:hypothetical protein
LCTSATADSIADSAADGGPGKHSKTVFVYLGLSLFCVLFDNLYAVFGHGVRSLWMDLMFLFPLLGGVLPFFLLGLRKKNSAKPLFSRLAFNLHNSGIAALTSGSLLRGIMEIAGTGSQWIALFFLTGAVFVIAGIAAAGKTGKPKNIQ